MALVYLMAIAGRLSPEAWVTVPYIAVLVLPHSRPEVVLAYEFQCLGLSRMSCSWGVVCLAKDVQAEFVKVWNV